MEKKELGHHISRQFDQELETIRSHVLIMGGMVEDQISQAIQALVQGESQRGEDVGRKDDQVDRLELTIDDECTRVLARRQPAAGDLRLVLTVLKAVIDLERIGDEAEKIGRMAAQLAQLDRPAQGYVEVEHFANHVRGMLRDSLDAFARLDSEMALKILREDTQVDREYEAIVRQYITFMMEDPRTIRRVMDTIWCVRALERIGDHSRNIAEYVIYLVGGTDVRHRPIDEIAQVVEVATRSPST